MIDKERVVIIVGAMKCGTSSLYDYAVDHSELAPCIIKEPEFFSQHQRHRVEAADYADLWPDYDPAVHRFAIEASTGYSKFPGETGVPERMHAYGLNPKLIYIVRNPFERILSHFRHVKHLSYERPLLDEHLLSTSMYYTQLEQYLRYFRQDNMLVLDFDDLVAEPAATVRRVWRFLGLADGPVRPSYRASNASEHNYKLRERFRRNGCRLPIPGRVLDFGDRLLTRLRPVPKPALSPAEADFVHESLKADMRRLNAVFGVPGAKWGF